MPPIAVGDPAPDVSFRTHDGGSVRLADYVGKRPVVVFFYPKDGTPLCTQEACAFRDAFERFTDAGAEVIGVSADGEAAHRAFAARHKLPYLLATDGDGALRKAFGVPRTLGLFPGRVTYVIDTAGKVTLAFSSQLSSGEHVTRALAALGAAPDGER
jgi:thioredoxin-dependent peroxiredoxin